jgi:hypothetical protein
MKKYLLLPMLLGLFMLIAQPAFSFCSSCSQPIVAPYSPCLTGCAVPVAPAPQLVYQPRVISQVGTTCCPRLSYCPKTVLEPVVTYQPRTVLNPVMTYETRTFTSNSVVYEPQLVCPQTCGCPTPYMMGAAAPIGYVQPICCHHRNFWNRLF